MATNFTMTVRSEYEYLNAGEEIARILRAVADRLEAGLEGNMHLQDDYGNGVGRAFFEVWEGEEA